MTFPMPCANMALRMPSTLPVAPITASIARPTDSATTSEIPTTTHIRNGRASSHGWCSDKESKTTRKFSYEEDYHCFIAARLCHDDLLGTDRGHGYIPHMGHDTAHGLELVGLLLLQRNGERGAAERTVSGGQRPGAPRMGIRGHRHTLVL